MLLNIVKKTHPDKVHVTDSIKLSREQHDVVASIRPPAPVRYTITPTAELNGFIIDLVPVGLD